ncbi:hypothetical protein [Dyadobacter pollutisoli]|jgi:hypothetical protein|uniref:DUF4831 family protein n=1 Tax=Dyadobacter pollutisoli TaxID=2910158 RepID=A0A9E8N6Z6_9BACT|nr:hypothetical protein [Dyadobacter pollutisoli]WAC10955.1 hypothetical protein ON006_24810 [Dyadobacter pollutisoli]
MRTRFFILLVILELTCTYCQAQISWDQALLSNGLRVYPDVQDKHVYYYPPAGMTLVKNRDGDPDFRMVMMRYTGRKLSQDRQKKVFRNICQFKVAIQMPAKERLAAIRAELGNVTLKRMPLNSIESFLIYTPAVPSEKGFIVSGNTEEASNNSGDERTFTVQVSNEDAQILEKAFQKQQALISVGYAFFAEGVSSENESVIVHSGKTINPEFADFLQDFRDSLNLKPVKKVVLAGAGSQGITLPTDYQKFLSKIDVNEQLPPEYAMIDVRCYDFNNDLRTDLYAKKIEIEALSIENKPIVVHATFYRRSPDIYVKNVRFDYAVRVDAPLRYRITEISEAGIPFVKGWTESKEWGPIDITGK